RTRRLTPPSPDRLDALGATAPLVPHPRTGARAATTTLLQPARERHQLGAEGELVARVATQPGVELVAPDAQRSESLSDEPVGRGVVGDDAQLVRVALAQRRDSGPSLGRRKPRWRLALGHLSPRARASLGRRVERGAGVGQPGTNESRRRGRGGLVTA